MRYLAPIAHKASIFGTIYDKNVLYLHHHLYEGHFAHMPFTLHHKLRYSIIFIIFLSLAGVAVAQTVIPKNPDGIVNNYAAVESITNNQIITLKQLPSRPFRENDTVLLIQMTGINASEALENAGRYEFHIIQSINDYQITLSTKTGSYDPTTEFVQLIHVPSYKNATVTGKLTCTSWDWEKGTGGVLVFMVEETLTLDANIDVSGLGFEGGGVSGTYTGDCPLIYPPPSDPSAGNYADNANNTAGYKGYGAIMKSIMTNTPRGQKPAFNGGGGGYGKWAGGGGGGNGGQGGQGGIQACETSLAPNYVPNQGVTVKYTNGTSDQNALWQSRAFMGGGGGSGTGENTPGGNGGGLVIIAAKKLQFNGQSSIKANGNSVDGRPSAGGAGGGGAGGSVLLSIETFSGNMNIELKGGKGGDAQRNICNDEASGSLGSGGGGGGGLLFMTINNTQLDKDVICAQGEKGVLRTSSGSSSNCSNNDIAFPGYPGQIINGLQLPLKGFLWNAIYTPDTTICYNTPATIKASTPITGTYQWQQKTESTWGAAPTPNNQQNYTTPLLSKTTSFRRIVTGTPSGGQIINDISASITISVIPEITDNIVTINGKSEVCENKDVTTNITGTTAQGGNGTITYQWEQNGNTIRNATDKDLNNITLSPSGDRNYRRIAISAGCKNASNTATLQIQPAINTSILNQNPVLLNFQFETTLSAEPDGGEWSIIKGSMVFNPSNQPTTHVSNLGLGTNIAQWKVEEGVCADSARVTIDVVAIPSGFSPNGDNINDCFQVGGVQDAVNSELIIFNRNNNIVYRSSPYKGNNSDCTGWWDGRNSSGKELPSGTYFYQLTIDGNVYKGYVVLKR